MVDQIRPEVRKATLSNLGFSGRVVRFNFVKQDACQTPDKLFVGIRCIADILPVKNVLQASGLQGNGRHSVDKAKMGPFNLILKCSGRSLGTVLATISNETSRQLLSYTYLAGECEQANSILFVMGNAGSKR